MACFKYSQVNVFSADPLSGNPLAVVHDADGLSDEKMHAIARWTNLSETTFLLKPEDPKADYRVRIFSPACELPFAGHPTLGTCYAWLAAGGMPRDPNLVVQQCGVGLVHVKREGTSLEFAAPPLIRSGPLEDDVLSKVMAAFNLSPADIVGHQWVDNGPGWCAVMLESAQRVLALKPDWATLAPLNLGVVGRYPPGQEADIEVRSFIGEGGYEDPVTGSLNASLAQWLIKDGLIEAPYTAAQGTILQRAGRAYLRQDAGEIWVGGQTVEVIRGEIEL
ncbi:PhzF family phenazine biosynthesis protein [Marinobacterium litorale]|uniref:PhzF family phenazine biosynthesis protein n=1 Tax=Marinobacterium litorale TaxID=404770 RepID=UPI00040E4772|nr:PhzF family phenazine biosynthesis protein [Marinobacterium litorale]